MAKKKAAASNELTTVPKYLTEYNESTGLEEAVQYISPGRIKCVQKLTRAPLSENFNPGDVVLVPQNLLVAELPYNGAKPSEHGKVFEFTPLLFFPEWIATNPIGADRFVRERSLSRKSALARKARDPELRKETIDGKEVRNREVLNFIIKLHDDELGELPIVMSFMSGEWRTGSNFLTLMKLRKAPIFSMRFKASASERSNDEGNWYGLDITNAEQQWVEEEHIGAYAAMHEEYKEAHNAGKIAVDHDEEEEEEVAF